MSYVYKCVNAVMAEHTFDGMASTSLVLSCSIVLLLLLGIQRNKNKITEPTKKLNVFSNACLTVMQLSSWKKLKIMTHAYVCSQDFHCNGAHAQINTVSLTGFGC